MTEVRRAALAVLAAGVVIAAGAAAMVATTGPGEVVPPDETIRVPQDHASIQDAIDAAAAGGTVIVSPGTYDEDLTIDRSLTLASAFLETDDLDDVAGTVITSDDTAIVTEPSAAPGVRIVGLTLRGGEDSDDGISTGSAVTLEDSRIEGFDDGVDTQNEDGEQFVARRNVIEGQTDDGIDLDDATGALIEDNVLRNTGQDGIEIRLHDFDAPLDIVIRGNVFENTTEDGVQIIEIPGADSDRHIRIERNLMLAIGSAAVGLMDEAETEQDFRAASVTDQVDVLHNTIVDTAYGISGGNDLVAVNNLVSGFTGTAFWGVDGDSIVAHNLVWGQGTPHDDSNVAAGTLIEEDPRLDADHRPTPDSPAVDAGVARFEHRDGEVFTVPADAYAGGAPDLGAFEAGQSAR